MIQQRMLAIFLSAVAALAVAAAPAVAQKAPVKPAAKKAKKPATSTKSSKKKTKSTRKAPSACAGLTKTKCGAKKMCGWIVPKKKVSSNGRKLTPYCRKTSGVTKKK